MPGKKESYLFRSQGPHKTDRLAKYKPGRLGIQISNIGQKDICSSGLCPSVTLRLLPLDSETGVDLRALDEMNSPHIGKLRG